MRRLILNLGLLLCATTGVFAQAVVSDRLQNALDQAGEAQTPIQAVVVLDQQVDIVALDRQLYAERASLNERAFRVITALQEMAASTQGEILDYLNAKTTSEVVSFREFWIANMIQVEAVPSVLLELSRNAKIGFMDLDATLEWDRPVARRGGLESSPNGSEPGLRAINAHLMWAAGFTGAGRIVMNDDTGVDWTHPAYTARWRGNFVPHNQAWFENGAPSNGTPNDCDGHGSHTMGTMCGLVTSTNDTIGVAFDAQWIASNGICTSPHTTWSIAAWQWAMDPDGNPNTITDMPDVISNSWYDPSATDCGNGIYRPVMDAVEAAGIAIVFSAGNNGPGASTLTIPKNTNTTLVNAFATGAVNANGSWPYPIASFSSRGPSTCGGTGSYLIKPEASAPGVNVRSSVPGGSFANYDGTSMAAPHVSGAIALLKQAHPNRTGHELKMALYNTARDLGAAGEDNDYGMGFIDVWAAHLSLADPLDPKPVSNADVYSDYTTPTSAHVTWTDPTEFENGDTLINFAIDVYREATFAGSVAKGVESFTDNGLTTYNQYTYKIYTRATPSDSLSSDVSVGPVYAGGHPVPEKPTGVGVVGGPVSGTVSWTNPTLMLDGTPIHDLQYIYVYRNGVELDSVSQGVPTTQYMDTPPDGGFYTYTLKAKLSTGYMSALSDGATAYIGPAPDIEVTPDTLMFSVVTNGLDSGYYSIHNTGLDTLEITGIEGEEINPTVAFVPLFEQAQKYTPDYPKGSMEPTYGDQTDGKGGPDPFGYKWIDSDEPGGPAYNWFDISSIGTQITTWLGTADDGRAKVLLPFAFPFYGNSYSHVWVGTNGFLSFADTITTSYLTNAAIPSAALPNNIIAGMWDDLNATGMAVRYYDDAANGRFVVQYNVVRYGTTLNYVFQVLLYTSGKVVVQYNQMDGTRLNEATVGIENSDGTQGLQVVYNANYVHNSLAVQFSRGALWLAQTPTTGSIPPGDSLQVKANVNATGLLGGTYYAKAMIDNNVPLLGPYAHPIFKMTVTGVPDIGVSPSSLDFGEVFVNYPDTLSFRVTNTGSDVLHVTNMYTGTSEYDVVGPTSFDVGVGLYQDVDVVFESAYQGIYTDTVTILSDGNSGTKQVALMAEAVSIPAISVAPDSLYFDLLTNQVDSASYVIRNTGSGTLVVSSIEAEEINASLAPWTQEQKYSPEYPKGAMEPVLGEVTDGRGGPDPFGYKWIDSDEPGGPAFNWVDISSVGTLVTGWLGSTGTANDDDGYVTVALPFGFTYYGATVNSIRIVTNGWISLDAASTNTAYSNVAIPVAAEPNQGLYPFWDDMDLDPALGGTVYYYHDAANNRFIVQYTNVPHYSGTTGTYTFQVMLYPSGKIVYQYLSMLQTINNATIGMENSDGTMGLQVVYNANYMHDNLAIVLSRGATWMTQDQTGGVIAPGDSLVVKVNVDAAGLTGNTYRAKVVIASNDPDHPTTEKPIVSMHVIGVADIGVAPPSLDFGTHFINTTDTLSYTVTNTGTDQLNVTGMTHTASQFTLLGPTTFSLGVGENHVVPVVFSSSAVGVFTDTVTITSNGVSGTKMVALAGEAIALPDIEVDTLLALGQIGAGEEDSTSFWIHNRGLSDLEYSILEGEDMFTALGFGQPNTSRVRINPLRPVLNQVKRSAGGEDGVTSTASAEVTGDLRTPTASTMAQFDLQFAYDATAVTGAAGNAAAVYANGEFWTSRWASNILHRWNPDGTLIEQFTVTGVTGTRGLTWDGQYLYAGINTATIQVIDQASKTLVGTIATSGAGNVRFIAYDPVRDGFWVGNFTGNIFCVNRSGSVIATITTSLAGKYGAAYDGFSEGGPYLWVWDQGGGDGTPQLVYQFNLNTLTATGLQFDVASISAIGPGIAGGLFITDELVPGKATLGGMLQGGVGNTDKLWGLELASSGLVWLDVSPSEGTIAAGDSAQIMLYMHGIVPAQIVVPVSGYLGIASNDPDDPMVNVHVTMDIVVGVDDQNTTNALPTKYALHANYPNPFNPTTTIKYDLKEAGAVSLKVYNILGQEVRTLVNARETAGFKVATWDGRNNAGQTVASGIYIYRLETEKFTKSRKMMMLK